MRSKGGRFVALDEVVRLAADDKVGGGLPDGDEEGMVGVVGVEVVGEVIGGAGIGVLDVNQPPGVATGAGEADDGVIGAGLVSQAVDD